MVFLTRTCPNAEGPGYSHWPVAAKTRPDCATSASVSVSWATGDLAFVVSGWRCAATAYDAPGPRVALAPDAVAAPDSDTPSVSAIAAPGARATPPPPRCRLTQAPSRDRPDRRATRAPTSWCPCAAYSQYRVPQADCQLSSQFANISLVVPDADTSSVDSTTVGLGAALRRAWLGYQLRLDEAMADAGFGDRRFPDGRVLRVCAGEAGSTISAIGRELGITRQGASKVVAQLSDRGYVVVADSSTSKREKSVVLTPLGVDYLAHQRERPGRSRTNCGPNSGTRRSLRSVRCSPRWTRGTGCVFARTFVAPQGSDARSSDWGLAANQTSPVGTLWARRPLAVTNRISARADAQGARRPHAFTSRGPGLGIDLSHRCEPWSGSSGGRDRRRSGDLTLFRSVLQFRRESI